MEGLSIICAGLGTREEDDDYNLLGYSPGEYCLDNLKDLLRFLRRDDPQTREVFKQVCKWNTVSQHLIPIIELHQDNRNLVLNAVKVLVFLTMPVEPTSSDIPQQIEYLWRLKSSITSSDTVAVAVSLLESPLENLENEAFTEDDWKLVQLVLTLFRNILAIQDISLQQKVGGLASQFLSLRDGFLELLFQENVMDLILVLTQHVGGSYAYFRQDNLLLLETFHYILMGQDPELIARAYMKGTKVDGDAEATLNSLKSIMEEEAEKRKITRLRNLGCYTQFSGTFTRLTMDGSKTLFKGNPCSASRDTLLKSQKIYRGPSKKMVWEHGKLPSTKDSILERLHDFVNQFLSGGYNVLMQSIREDIEKEHHAIESSDVVIFFQVAQFVTSFQYQKLSILKPNIEANTYDASVNHHADSTLFKGSICGPIAASMNESMFLLVILKWRNAFDGLKETNDYKFLSAAGSLMNIMIRMLDLVLKQSPENSKEPQTVRILLYKLFYDQTDQGMTQFLLSLFKSFDTHKQSKSDLANLLETIHVVVRLLEKLQTRGTLRVSRKSRKRKAKKTSNVKKDIVNETVGDHVNIQNEIGVSGCEQTINTNVSEKETSTNLTSEGKGEEDIIVPLQVDEPEKIEMDMENPGSKMKETDYKKSDNANDDYGTEDSSGDEQLPVTDEVDFQVSTLVSALANTTIIQNLCWLLKFYKSNSTGTNHYIICMLRRICDDLELSPMLYQLSLLTTFHDILGEQKSSPCKEYENIVVFLTSLVRRMLRKMKSYPLLFVELLFWKTRKECHYINCESMLNDLGNLKKEYRKGGSVPEDGEVAPSEGKEWVRRSIADALGDDEADFLISPGIYNPNEENLYEAKAQKVLKRNNASKESITSISNEGIDGKENSDNEGNYVEHESGRPYKRMKPLVLNDEMEEKIKDLYEKYKENQNCNHLIAEDMDGKVSPAQISKKLKQLGLKFPPKRRMLRTGGSNQLSEELRASGSQVTRPHSLDLEETSSLRQPLNTRKRVQAFSEDQELMIRALFEQFRDHKRCSYMIAKSLDTDGTFTTAQVSRKLKQLGLLVLKQKKSDANLHLRDEDLNDFSTEAADNSDNETLLSLRKRRKKKQSPSESEERPNQKTDGKLSQNGSDDELLSSVLGSKNKQSVRESKERPYGKTGGKLSQGGSDEELPSSVMGDGHKQHANMEAAENGNVSFYDDDLGISSGQHTSVPFVDKADHLPHQQLHDELADFGDDMAPASSQKATVSRRKLRMVIDPEDDE